MKGLGMAIMLIGGISLVGAAGAADANIIGFSNVVLRCIVSAAIMTAGYVIAKKGEENESWR